MRWILMTMMAVTAGCAAPEPPQAASEALARGAGAPLGKPGSAPRGEILAKLQCSGCHAVGRSEASPMLAAPPFPGLAQRYPVSQLQEALGEGLVTSHPAMPEIQLAPDDIADLIAYLDAVGAGSSRGP